MLLCAMAIASAAALVSGCSSDSSGGGDDALAGATTFGGLYPTPVVITYDDAGTPVSVLAFPGHVQVYADPAAAQETVEQRLGANGGTVLSKIPAAGYFLCGVTAGAEPAFIANARALPDVLLAQPHVPGKPKRVAVLAECGSAHAEAVIEALEASGGTLEACRPIDAEGEGRTELPPDLVNLRLLQAAGAAGKRGAIVVLAANGGLAGVDWTLRPPAEQALGAEGWRHYVRSLLACIAGLSETRRENLVVAVAAGNENMPLDGILARLRTDARLAAALAENVLIVTTTLASGNGNASRDTDVAIVNNAGASLGTSLAAPAAAAIVERVAAQAPATRREALLGAKVAVGKNADHVLVESEALAEVRSGNTQPCNVRTEEGGDASETHTFQMARTSGTFTFAYRTYGIEDRLVVTYQGATIYDSGCVATGDDEESVEIDFGPGTSSTVTVQVTPNCAGDTEDTAWEFTVGCPSGP
jgi:hypothetical protein